VTDDTGTVLWSWNSDAFGTTLANEDVDGDNTDFEFNLKFSGQYFDKESGQHYNYFRDYEPGTGRYLESDPIGLGSGEHPYNFGNVNPVSFYDLLGLATYHNFSPKEEEYMRKIVTAAVQKLRNCEDCNFSDDLKIAIKSGIESLKWAKITKVLSAGVCMVSDTMNSLVDVDMKNSKKLICGCPSVVSTMMHEIIHLGSFGNAVVNEGDKKCTKCTPSH